MRERARDAAPEEEEHTLNGNVGTAPTRAAGAQRLGIDGGSLP